MERFRLNFQYEKRAVKNCHFGNFYVKEFGKKPLPFWQLKTAILANIINRINNTTTTTTIKGRKIEIFLKKAN